MVQLGDEPMLHFGWVMRTLVSEVITRELDDLDLRFPEVDADKRDAIKAARAELENE